MSEAEIRQLVQAHPKRVNQRDWQGLTALFVAAYSRESLPLVLWLLDKKGADVNATTGSGATALCMAPTVDIVNALMDRGANPIVETNKGYTPLMAYSSFKQITSVARLLRDQRVRANINVRNQYGHTTLHLACQSKEEEGNLPLLLFCCAPTQIRTCLITI